MSYLTWREYVRAYPICLGALLTIGGAVMALLPGLGYDIIEGYTITIGAVVAIVGLLLMIIGFIWTRKKRDSVLAPVDTRPLEDTPPPPPPPD